MVRTISDSVLVGEVNIRAVPVVGEGYVEGKNYRRHSLWQMKTIPRKLWKRRRPFLFLDITY
jgi:hypothetical protein